MNVYHPGDLVELKATFTDPTGQTYVDPTTVVFTVRQPDLTVDTPFVTRQSQGVYTCTVSVTEAGEWRYRATGTGAAQATQRGVFQVNPLEF